MDPESNGSGLEITRVADKDCHADQKFIYPMCKTTHPNVVVDTQKLKLITVAAVNFGHMRLVQQFAHPVLIMFTFSLPCTYSTYCNQLNNSMYMVLLNL